MRLFTVLLGASLALSLLWQAWSYYQFKEAGKRFTAADGQELCLRVKNLDGGDCAYNTK